MGKLTAAKAREMIDNPPHGKKLTPKQNAYFHLVAEGRNKYKGGEWLDKYADGGDVKQRIREKLYRTIPPSDYPIRQLPSVVKNLITGRERMNSLDEINQLLEEREQLSPIIKQYEKDFSRAWDSSYGEGRHEAK